MVVNASQLLDSSVRRWSVSFGGNETRETHTSERARQGETNKRRRKKNSLGGESSL